MILSNFIKVMSGGLNSTNTKTAGGSLKKYYISHTSFAASNFSFYNNGSYTPSYLSISSMGIALSSDTSVPTVDDYQFTNFYTANDLFGVDTSLNAEPMQTVLTQTVRNDGTENIVINSVGVFGRYNTTSEVEVVLLTKTLLDTPVTVAPGEVKTITVTIDYNSFVENVNA